MSVFLKLMWIAILTASHWLMTDAALFTSTAELSQLVVTEDKLVVVLKKHIEIQENKLKHFKRLVQELSREHEIDKHSQDYVKNPIKSYLLLNLISLNSSSWKEFLYEMGSQMREEFLEDITNFETTEILPRSYDLNGARAAILRLQETYNLSSDSIANGILNGTHYNTKLTAGDCYRIGLLSLEHKNYDTSISWMKEGLKRLEEEYHKTANKTNILMDLVYSAYMKGNYHQALELTKDVLKESCDRNVLYNQIFYENLFTIENKSEKVKDEVKNTPEEENRSYSRHCRHEIFKPASETFKFKCRYTDNGNAFLRLARVKEEDILDDPKIMYYHDVIHDSEIELLKKIPMSKCDKFPKEDTENNRIGTFLYYLNDVEQGGATAFPLLNVTVKPKKGAAAFWYDLFPSGDPDYRTLHGGCPVLVGSKWIATKWFRMKGHEFVKPCRLTNLTAWTC